MSVQMIAVGALVGLAAGVVLLASVGLLVTKRAYDRLHCVSLATIWGPVLVFAAVLVQRPEAAAIVKMGLILVLAAVMGPVLTHLTGRAILLHELGEKAKAQGDEGAAGGGEEEPT